MATARIVRYTPITTRIRHGTARTLVLLTHHTPLHPGLRPCQPRFPPSPPPSLLVPDECGCVKDQERRECPVSTTLPRGRGNRLARHDCAPIVLPTHLPKPIATAWMHAWTLEECPAPNAFARTPVTGADFAIPASTWASPTKLYGRRDKANGPKRRPGTAIRDPILGVARVVAFPRVVATVDRVRPPVPAPSGPSLVRAFSGSTEVQLWER